MKPSVEPKISVVIHSYNVEKYLDECIESVLGQTLPPHEIIICDDHSTDQSWSIIERYRKKHPDLIMAYRHDSNIGMVRNVNFARKKVMCNIVSSLDGDDRWLPRKLEMEWKALESNPDAKIAYSNVYTIDEQGKQTGIWYNGEGVPPPSGDVFVQVYCGKCFPNRMNLYRQELMYRSVLEELEYFDESVEIFIDLDFKIRASARFPVAYSGEALVEYRIQEGGIHNRPFEQIFKDMIYVLAKNLNLTTSRSREESSQIYRGIAERALGYVAGIKYAADERLELIGRLEEVARERLQLIENLDTQCKMYQRAIEECKRSH